MTSILLAGHKKIASIHWVHISCLHALLSLMCEGNGRPQEQCLLHCPITTGHFILVSITLQESFILPNNLSVFCLLSLFCFGNPEQREWTKEDGPQQGLSLLVFWSRYKACLILCIYRKVGKKDRRQESCGQSKELARIWRNFRMLKGCKAPNMRNLLDRGFRN